MSTTHIASASGALLESYRYDLYGTPSYFNQNNEPIAASAHGITDLHAGERWVSELGLYDLRNRFMSPELGRFLQADPIGFKGDRSNLYRYCHNDSANFSDPMGLQLTASWWNNQMWRQGGSILSILQFDAIRQGTARLEWSISRDGDSKRDRSGPKSSTREIGGSDIRVKRTMVNQEHRKLWGLHRGVIEWRDEYTDASGNPMAGVHVDETMAYGKSHHLLALHTRTRGADTRADGSLTDNYGATFSSSKGWAIVDQTVRIQGAGEVKWSGKLYATGAYEINDVSMKADDSITATFR